MRIAVVGAGRMGGAVVFDLAKCDSVEEIIVADVVLKNARSVVDRFAPDKGRAITLDAASEDALGDTFAECDVVVSAAPYRFNAYLARAALAGGCHFCDMGGNNAIVEQEMTLHKRAVAASVSIVPDCGLAPGLVNVLAAGLINKLDEVESVRLRVGGLPQDPEPPLNYSISFSVYGLINEYDELCRIISDYKISEVEPLTGLESLTFAGFGELEAFHTSGGSSSLPTTYQGKIKDLDYKTIRYAGHCQDMSLLRYLGFFGQEPLKESGCRSVVPRDCLAAAFTNKLKSNAKDLILLRCEAEGTKDGSPAKFGYELVDYYDEENGISAMMRCTAFPVAITAKYLGRGEAPPGTLSPEQAVDSETMIKELATRGVNIKEI